MLCGGGDLPPAVLRAKVRRCGGSRITGRAGGNVAAIGRASPARADSMRCAAWVLKWHELRRNPDRYNEVRPHSALGGRTPSEAYRGWFAVTVRSVPRAGRLDDLMQFEVLLPPGSGPGSLVARPHLRLLGLDSAPAYRLYMSLCWYWDHYGTRRGRLIGADAPAPGKRPAAAAVNVSGRLINPVALRWYPALSPDDVAAMSYALGDLAADGTVRRNQRRAAREALERVANVTGAIVVPAEQADGVRGCVRVLPPPDHKAAHDAAAELWRAKRPRDLTTGTR